MENSITTSNASTFDEVVSFVDITGNGSSIVLEKLLTLKNKTWCSTDLLTIEAVDYWSSVFKTLVSYDQSQISNVRQICIIDGFPWGLSIDEQELLLKMPSFKNALTEMKRQHSILGLDALKSYTEYYVDFRYVKCDCKPNL